MLTTSSWCVAGNAKCEPAMSLDEIRTDDMVRRPMDALDDRPNRERFDVDEEMSKMCQHGTEYDPLGGFDK